MIGYTDRATRCRGSRSRMEWSSTPAPSSGYMFWIAPIQTPSMPVRRSPKYFHVNESGPSGSALSMGRRATFGVDLRVIGSYPFCALRARLESKPLLDIHDNVDNARCLRFAGRGGHSVMHAPLVLHSPVTSRFIRAFALKLGWPLWMRS